jgi:hypothetical protein
MQTAAHNNQSYIQLHTLQGQHKAGNDKHNDRTERYRKCRPAMQVPLQPTHNLANRKINPKHCLSTLAYCHQDLENWIHYKNSQRSETVSITGLEQLVMLNEKFFFLFQMADPPADR